MLVVREFEFFESENCTLFFLANGLGATQGEDLQDAIEFAADWLYWTVIYDMINEKPIEKFELGHEPQHGGIVIWSPLIAVLRALKHSPLQKQLVFGCESAR